MNHKNRLTEVLVGIFMVLGFTCFLIVAMRFGSTSFFTTEGYTLIAKFDSVSGLKNGSLVEIAGVKIGKVTSITLDGYQARVAMNIKSGIQVEDDAMASIRTKGIIGEKYVKFTSGASEDILADGDEVVETEPVLDIEEMIGKFIYGK